MKRAITGYYQDLEAAWVAELTCGHNQHVRHRPPFQLRPWAMEEAGRAAKLGTPLNCPLCDRTELPDDLAWVRSSPEWNERTIPPGLLRAHRLASDTWGQLLIAEGRLRFFMSVEPVSDTVLEMGSSQAIPPDVEHHVRLLGPVSFTINFLAVEERRRTTRFRDSDSTQSSASNVTDRPGWRPGVLGRPAVSRVWNCPRRWCAPGQLSCGQLT